MPKYFMISRPPGIGCQPEGATQTEIWRPRREHKGRAFHGFVEYPERLAPEQVRRYELFPDDVSERAALIFEDEPDWVLESYREADTEMLLKTYRRCRYSWAALVQRGIVL